MNCYCYELLFIIEHSGHVARGLMKYKTKHLKILQT